MSGRIAVLGGGAWGTALASLQARAERPTVLFARDPATVAAVNNTGRNPRYLPNVPLAPGLEAAGNLAAALDGARTVLVAVPAQSLRPLAQDLRSRLVPGVPLVLCAKGIERGSGLFPSAVLAAELPDTPLAVLSGPSFASDVARGLPTAVTLAALDEALLIELAASLSADTFRIYASGDVLGVEAGGALKNVLAIAAGIVHGAGLGASAIAAVTTRGFAELRRLGEALGARAETLAGLSGLGDLLLTCASEQSRNFAYGSALGRGTDTAGLLLAEGVPTAGVAARLAAAKGIDAPLIRTVAAILDDGLPVEAAIAALLARPLKREAD